MRNLVDKICRVSFFNQVILVNKEGKRVGMRGSVPETLYIFDLLYSYKYCSGFRTILNPDLEQYLGF